MDVVGEEERRHVTSEAKKSRRENHVDAAMDLVRGRVSIAPSSCLFVLRQRYAEDEHNVTITVPMFEPVPPNYYISLASERWLRAETRLPISFKHCEVPSSDSSP